MACRRHAFAMQLKATEAKINLWVLRGAGSVGRLPCCFEGEGSGVWDMLCFGSNTMVKLRTHNPVY